MLETQYLFSNPPISIGDVLGLVFSIFFSNWKSFVLISGLYYISLFTASFIAGIISFAAFADTIVEIASNIPVSADDGYGRHLLDYATGTSGTSRVLQYYYGNGDIEFDDIDYATISAALLSVAFELIFICIIFATVLCVVASIFTGALNHAVAEIYTGGSPSVSRSMVYGWQQKWKVYLFSILWMFIVVAILLVDIGIPASTKSETAIWLGLIIALVMMTILSTVLIGAVPSIVVENKTPFDAFQRSYNLCKNYFCFIFCNTLTFNILSLIFSIMTGVILDEAPASISFILHLMINVTMLSFGPILVMVLYISIRIRSEQLTGQELSDELSNIVPVANAVEMSDSDYRAIKPEV